MVQVKRTAVFKLSPGDTFEVSTRLGDTTTLTIHEIDLRSVKFHTVLEGEKIIPTPQFIEWYGDEVGGEITVEMKA